MDKRDELLKKFGKYLTTLREERAFSVQKLASATGLTSHTLHRIEAGEVDILFSTVIRLSKALNITPGELLQSLDPD
jgi:transcriptional regulator with XRE-family HTH domain